MLPIIKLKPEVNQYLQESLCNDSAKQKYGPECPIKFNSILSSLSWPPSFTTLRLEPEADESEPIVKLVKELLAEQYIRRQKSIPEIRVHPLLDDCLVIDNHGPCAVTPVDLEVIVDSACGMSVLRGSDVFVQGIMAASPGVHEGDTVSVFVDTDRLCRKGLAKRFEGSKLFVGNGVAAVSRQDLFAEGGKVRSGIGVSMTEPLFIAPSLSDLSPQLVFPQNLPSIVCVHVLDPHPGETILDMCAAPGGKTTHIATLMKRKGRIVALDKSKTKINKLRENVARWKLNDLVEVYCFDAVKALDLNSDSAGSPSYPPELFDRILLDAPCSGLGQRPTVVSNVSLVEVTSYPPLQKRLFEKAVGLLKYGGVLVYSTCTITIEENESIVAWALKRFPHLKLVAQVPHVAGPAWPCSELDDESSVLIQRFSPSLPRYGVSSPVTSCDTDTIGFFIAKFVKEHAIER